MTVFNARALASLVTVAGSALSKRLTVILGALVKVTEDEKDEELSEAIDEAIRALFVSIDDAEGLNTLMLVLLGWYASLPYRYNRIIFANEMASHIGFDMNHQSAVLALATSSLFSAKSQIWTRHYIASIGYASLYH